MRVLMLSWEYPPKSVGGLAQHVYDLTNTLAESGVEVHLITCGAPGVQEYENVRSVQVYRVNPYNISAMDFVTWATQLNVAMLERAMPLILEKGDFSIIHAHDWLTVYAARALKHGFHIPLVATIHATEHGRNYGLHNDTQRHISDLEWWLGYEAWKVICCSKYMRDEIRRVFQIPEDKLVVIPNGVNPDNYVQKQPGLSRDDFASPDEKIVFYVGRLVREKGVQVLLDAVRHILTYHPKTKFVIAGKGPYDKNLREQAVMLGVSQSVYFTGYVNDQVRNSLYSWADVAVFPSLYEPFGIVALEAMAANTPVVIADTGGLSEIIEHGKDGLKSYVGNPTSLADMILRLLHEPQLGNYLRQNAGRKIRQEYNRQQIARQTRDIYRHVVSAHRNTMWDPVERRSHLFNRVSRLLARNA
ncbi:MAG: glycosyltransferase family 4 protein [Bacillota bacterium]